MTDRRYRHRLYGLEIASDLQLPDAAPGSGAPPDVEIKLASVAPARGLGAPFASALEIAPSLLRFDVPGTARFQVEGGRTVTVDLAPEADGRDILLCLQGTALGALLLQRGDLPLHANAIDAGGYAVAFAGPSGAGKSTLALHFQQRGYPVLTDDLCAVRRADYGAMQAWPGVRRLKLLAATLDAAGLDSREAEPVGPGMEKLGWPAGALPDWRGRPLRAVYCLQPHGVGAAFAIERLRGVEAIGAVVGNSFRGELAHSMGLSELHMRQCLALVAQCAVFLVSRSWGLADLAGDAISLERHIVDALASLDVGQEGS